MARKRLFMESTKIDARKTVGEIMDALASAGATSINTDYKNGLICGLRWILPVNGKNAEFHMPARIDPVFKIIGNREQAVRVAWRQLLRWVEAQTAMIETGMVQPSEVYFAYHVPAGHDKTLFQIAMETEFKMLEPPLI